MIIPALKKHLRGFTLIELLIVIAILGILAAAVLVAINPLRQQQRARDAARKNDIGQIAGATEAFFTANNSSYPANLAALTTSSDLKVMPLDPLDKSTYTYAVSTDARTAYAYATLEATTVSGGVWCWRSAAGRASEAGSCSF